MRDFFLFFFNDTATTEIYTLSLHDALPISQLDGPAPELDRARVQWAGPPRQLIRWSTDELAERPSPRSEEHTSELQSQSNLVCRLLLGKKNPPSAPPAPTEPPSPARPPRSS